MSQTQEWLQRQAEFNSRNKTHNDCTSEQLQEQWVTDSLNNNNSRTDINIM